MDLENSPFNLFLKKYMRLKMKNNNFVSEYFKNVKTVSEYEELYDFSKHNYLEILKVYSFATAQIFKKAQDEDLEFKNKLSQQQEIEALVLQLQSPLVGTLTAEIHLELKKSKQLLEKNKKIDLQKKLESTKNYLQKTKEFYAKRKEDNLKQDKMISGFRDKALKLLLKKFTEKKRLDQKKLSQEKSLDQNQLSQEKSLAQKEMSRVELLNSRQLIRQKFLDRSDRRKQNQQKRFDLEKVSQDKILDQKKVSQDKILDQTLDLLILDLSEVSKSLKSLDQKNLSQDKILDQTLKSLDLVIQQDKEEKDLSLELNSISFQGLSIDFDFQEDQKNLSQDKSLDQKKVSQDKILDQKEVSQDKILDQLDLWENFKNQTQGKSQENQVWHVMWRWSYNSKIPEETFYSAGNIQKILDNFSNDYLFQLEKGPRTGLDHYQGYMKLKMKQRPKTLAKALNALMFGIEIQPIYTTVDICKAYCSKDETLSIT